LYFKHKKEHISTSPVKTEDNKALPSSTAEMPYYIGDITPDANTVLVFGSNPVGINGRLGATPNEDVGGAAAVAQRHFGVAANEIMDNKLSSSGQAYGLTTVSGPGKKKSMTPTQITNNVKRLYAVAKANPTKLSNIAYRNTTTRSLNGYTGLEMIEMFNQAGVVPNNIIFSKEWVDTGKLQSKSSTPKTGVQLLYLTLISLLLRRLYQVLNLELTGVVSLVLLLQV
jgi:hypothetical protein